MLQERQTAALSCWMSARCQQLVSLNAAAWAQVCSITASTSGYFFSILKNFKKHLPVFSPYVFVMYKRWCSTALGPASRAGICSCVILTSCSSHTEQVEERLDAAAVKTYQPLAAVKRLKEFLVGVTAQLHLMAASVGRVWAAQIDRNISQASCGIYQRALVIWAEGFLGELVVIRNVRHAGMLGLHMKEDPAGSKMMFASVWVSVTHVGVLLSDVSHPPQAGPLIIRGRTTKLPLLHTW